MTIARVELELINPDVALNGEENDGLDPSAHPWWPLCQFLGLDYGGYVTLKMRCEDKSGPDVLREVCEWLLIQDAEQLATPDSQGTGIGALTAEDIAHLIEWLENIPESELIDWTQVDLLKVAWAVELVYLLAGDGIPESDPADWHWPDSSHLLFSDLVQLTCETMASAIEEESLESAHKLQSGAEKIISATTHGLGRTQYRDGGTGYDSWLSFVGPLVEHVLFKVQKRCDYLIKRTAKLISTKAERAELVDALVVQLNVAIADECVTRTDLGIVAKKMGNEQSKLDNNIVRLAEAQQEHGPLAATRDRLMSLHLEVRGLLQVGSVE
jgi:hypothetical protein